MTHEAYKANVETLKAIEEAEVGIDMGEIAIEEMEAEHKKRGGTVLIVKLPALC